MTATFVKVLLAATALLAPACGAAPDPTGRGDAEFNTLRPSPSQRSPPQP